jgi:hypothetical protein
MVTLHARPLVIGPPRRFRSPLEERGDEEELANAGSGYGAADEVDASIAVNGIRPLWSSLTSSPYKVLASK